MNIGWRQLLVVAVVAIVFSGGAGYLGGNFVQSRFTGEAPVEAEQPRNVPTVSRPLVALGGGSLEERVAALEQEIGGGLRLLGGSIQVRLSELEDVVGDNPRIFGDSIQARLSQLEDEVGGGRRSLDTRLSQLEQPVGNQFRGSFFGGSLEEDVSSLQSDVRSLASSIRYLER